MVLVMAYVWGNLLLYLFAAVFVLVACITAYCMWSFRYWKRKCIPQLQPSIPFGNIKNPSTSSAENPGITYKNYYKVIKANGYKHGGFYATIIPQYIPTDLEYIKSILVREFAHFVDRGIYHNEKADPLGANLFSIEGNKWKNLRAKLTHTFTSSKMKWMFSILLECAEELVATVDEYCARNTPLDIKEVSSKFTTDVIGSCAFGVQCNSFRNPDAEFRRFGKRIFDRTNGEKLKDIFTATFPKLSKRLGVKMIQRDVSKFFTSVMEDMVAHRKTNVTDRNDFLQLLINLSNETSLTMQEITAQSLLFFAAGFETSSAVMCFCLLELSRNQEIQDKVREEILCVLGKYDGQITYDGLMEMKYLNQVVNETLRLYPPASFLQRICNKPYDIPGTNVTLDAGTYVIIPTLGIHHDEEYYPQPEKFDPERFNEEIRKECSPFTFLPFGEGPRNCIGLRFGLMQSKVGICILVKNYIFSFNNKSQYPVQFDPNGLSYVSRDSIWLDIKKTNA